MIQTNNVSTYRNLLLSVSTNIKSQEFMPYHSKSEYNIFRILEVAEKEVVMCRFLTDLLNPEGQHGCGILFLKSFFSDVLNENRINDTVLAHTDVIRELNELIKSIVMQYIDAIHFITNRKDDRMMEKNLEVLYESADFFSAGIQIEKSMKAAKLRLIRLVFDDFREEMKMTASKYGLELEKDAVYYCYDEKQHEKFYDCYSTYPGLNYVVKKAKFQKRSLQMWFRIEVEHHLFAGISLFGTEAMPKDGNSKGYQVNEITAEIIDEAAQYLNRDIITPADWWLAWCYPNGKRQDDDYNDVPDFKHMNQCAINLVDNQKRAEFVKNAVRVFEKQLLKYLL